MSVTVRSERFDHQGGGDYPGNRGVRVECDTGYSGGYAFSSRMPEVYLTDNGEVEFGVGDDHCCVPVEVFREWAEAVLAAAPAAGQQVVAEREAQPARDMEKYGLEGQG